MKNIKTTIVGSKLTIEVDLSAPGSPSASGKSMVVATTAGLKSIPGAPEQFAGYSIGVNVCKGL